MNNMKISEEYSQYLEQQLQKMMSFMLYQKKQNQKYKNLADVIEKQNQKIKALNDKILLMELYQNQNNKNQQKMFQTNQKALLLQKRVNKLQNAIVQIQRYLNTEYIQILSDPRQKNVSLNQIESRMDKIQRSMIQKVRKIQQVIYRNIDSLTMEVNDKKEKASPLLTSHSSNFESRLHKTGSTMHENKKQTKRKSPRVNGFGSTNQSEKEPEKVRSPISSYLKKEKQYSANQQNQYTQNREIISNSFYSSYDDQLKSKKNEVSNVNKVNKKKKKKRSNSKSNHSERSINQEIFINKKIKNLIKNQEEQSLKNLNKKEKSCVNKQHQKKQKSGKLYEQSKSKLNKSSFRSISRQKSKQSRSQSILSISQTSSKSTSQHKTFKNQKLYKFKCNKLH